MHAVLAAAEESAEAAGQLPLAAGVIGALALAALVGLLVVTHLFRNVGARNAGDEKDHSR